MTLDMTRGNPARLMIKFAIPLLLSSALQQLYSVFDSMIVGRMLGADAFAAVGSCSYLNWFPMSMIIGLTHGFGVLFSQRFGAGDSQGYRKALTNGTLLALLVGVALTFAGTSLATPLLTLLKTPVELIPDSASYLTVLWSGLTLTALYNVTGAALNGLGDSRTPLVALVIATVLNIALDYLFIATFSWGVKGAALATLISQLAALIFCAVRLLRVRFARPVREDWRPQRQTVKELLRLGSPLLLSYSVISTGELAVLTAINSCGLAFVTGTTAARRYFSLLNIMGNSLEAALATFVAQNAGAKQPKRILEGTRAAVWLGVGSSAAVTAIVALFAKPLILLFLPTGTAETVNIGVQALRAESYFLVSLTMLCLHRATIQGVGNSVVPMLSGFLELALRLAAAVLLPMLFAREGLYFTDAFTWVGTTVLLMSFYYFSVRPKLKRESELSQA